ncbi:MAG TPA: hypothetical protein VGF45_00725 [Polyangia bacterium]
MADSQNPRLPWVQQATLNGRSSPWSGGEQVYVLRGRTVENVEDALDVSLHQPLKARNISPTAAPVSRGVYSKKT